PYMFYIDFEKYVVLGASPESLLRVQGNHVELNPIAGTHPRGTTDSKDEQNIQKLLTDQKEIAEHDMLVELSKSDLQHVCKSKSITVPVHRQVEKYEHVMHIVSTWRWTGTVILLDLQTCCKSDLLSSTSMSC